MALSVKSLHIMQYTYKSNILYGWNGGRNPSIVFSILQQYIHVHENYKKSVSCPEKIALGSAPM